MALRLLLLPLVATLTGAAASAPATGLADVDVSRAAGPQAEVRIAADPRSPSHLLAASNSEPGMRAYGSSDGGRTWSSEILPSPPNSAIAPCQSDPAPAIDAGGNEYVVFIQSGEPCDQGGEHVTIRIAVREAGGGTWRYRSESAIPEDPRGSFDDNPWLAIDNDPASPNSGRLYLAWFRSVEGRRIGFEISHSDDRGAHWSEPRVVSDSVVDAGYPSLSIGAGGTVYAAWTDFGRRSLFLDVSADGGETFGRDAARRLRGRDEAPCPNGRSIPAQRLRCVRSDPTVLADPARGRVYLTYSDLARNDSEDVFVAAYDAHLRPIGGFPRRIGRPERTAADQFWPTAALDSSTGRLALCFYATGSGSARTRATFSCAVSRPSGKRWSRCRSPGRCRLGSRTTSRRSRPTRRPAPPSGIASTSPGRVPSAPPSTRSSSATATTAAGRGRRRRRSTPRPWTAAIRASRPGRAARSTSAGIRSKRTAS